jgi:hypothetical protein
MAKIMVIVWIVTGQIATLPAPFLPFVPALDYVHVPPRAFQGALLLAASVASAALLVNVRVRACCLVIGASILLGTLASRPFFANNRLFFACLMILIGLHEAGRRPLLLRIQVALVYFGAGLDKLLDADWRSGRFFSELARRLEASGAMWSPGWDTDSNRPFVGLYMHISDALPPMLLARLVSAAIIAAELGLAAALVIRPGRGAILMNLLLQTAMLLFTGSPLGMFFYAAVSASLVFIDFPFGASARAEGLERRLCAAPRTWLILAVVLSGPWFHPWIVIPLLVFFVWRFPSTGAPLK